MGPRSSTALNNGGASVVRSTMSQAFYSARQNIARHVAFAGNDSEYATHAISQAKQRDSILRLTFQNVPFHCDAFGSRASVAGESGGM